MRTLADATLTELERRVLERWVRLVEAEHGGDLHGIWLYGSRARGEPPHEESDVDVLVVSVRSDLAARRRLSELMLETAVAEGGNPWTFSIYLYSPERLEDRREIRSFFIQEVDRDKIVLAGRP